MRRFNMSVAKIKNSKGEYESIPALRDRSGYETAKANGYTGTEEQWMNDIYSDGWITAVQELDDKKANKTAVDEAIRLIYANIIPSWNVDENVGDICNSTTTGISVKSDTAGGYHHGHQIKGVAIPMINNGTIRIKCDLLMKYDATTAKYNPQTTFIKVYVNTNPVYESYYTGERLDESLSLDVEVEKGDVLSFIASAENTYTSATTSAITCSMDNIKLYANIETPFIYSNLGIFETGSDSLENPSTTEILDSLLNDAS